MSRNILVFILIVMLLSSTFTIACANRVAIIGPPNVRIALYAGEITTDKYGFGFTPKNLISPGPDLNFQLGDVVNVTVYNVGAIPHAWQIEYSLNATTSPVFGAQVGSAYAPLPPGTSGSVVFAVRIEGHFFYICPVSGHNELGDWGRVNVRQITVTRLPGVKLGDWAKYHANVGYSTNDPVPPEKLNPPPAEWEKVEYFMMEVQAVTGTVVQYKGIVHFKNGTETVSGTISTDVANPSMGFPFFVAANLSAGDPIYASPPTPTINQTLTRVYASAERETNHIYMRQDELVGPPGYALSGETSYYWDRLTGMLDELTRGANYSKFSGTYVTQIKLHLVMIETNIWQPTGITAKVELYPQTWNLKSKGEWALAILVLPKGYKARDIDSTTIRLNGTIKPVNKPFRIARWAIIKFDRQEITQLILKNIDPAKNRTTSITLTVSGKLKDGTWFTASATIRILGATPPHRQPNKNMIQK